MRMTLTLQKRGNAVALTITKHMLKALGWTAGDLVVEEILPDGTMRVRPLQDPAFRPVAGRPATLRDPELETV